LPSVYAEVAIASIGQGKKAATKIMSVGKCSKHVDAATLLADRGFSFPAMH